MLRRAGIATAVLCGLGAGSAFAQNATTPGAVTTPYPTTQAISIEWAITGDANNDGVVDVRYREAGATAWQTGLPLFRVPAGANDTGDFGSGNGQWPNKHAGSLFDLEPGKTYEIALTLTDPDGGGTTTTTTATTRPIPVAPATATTKPVTPSTLTSALAAAAPGDILLLGAGSYPSFSVSKSGATDQPIVIRGESADTAIIGGRVTMDNRRWVYLENVTVQGEVRLRGASNVVVRGCRIRTSGNGINMQTSDAIPRNNYIVDNDIVGGATWEDSQLGADGYDGGEGIQLTGSGHVVCWNHVKGFRDNISHMEYDEAFEQVSNDICNNDLEEATDDGIEADSAMGNVRVMKNRIRNCFVGASSQPSLGGPTYYIRNVMYNVVYSPFKFHNGTVGDVAFHNTVVKCGDGWGCYAGESWSRAFFRNNLFVGGAGGGTYGGYGNGNGRVLDLGDADGTCSFDYDGLGSIDTGKFEGKIGGTRFSSVATMQSSTTEVHGVQVDMGIFASSPAFPSNPFPPKPAPDLRLAAGSAAVDKGLALPGVNDGFSGAAPDLGAYEIGVAAPVYGPRTGGLGGVIGTGGVASTGGALGSGGAGGSMGTGGIGMDGGIVVDSGLAGGGAPGAGGVPGTGGAVGSRDAAIADGPGAAGGVSGGGGAVGTGGAPGTGGLSPDAGTAAGKGGGCGCNTVGPTGGGEIAVLVLTAFAALRRSRHRGAGVPAQKAGTEALPTTTRQASPRSTP
ncbi:MAG: right-handed parallel beta-helix repeat-containing protein [Deltaproteobacteria bacterium]|nr:right-handed parallel beta-helix repeat-containing protein [Deltaproteobacteria bacterium]